MDSTVVSAEQVTIPVAYHGEGPFWDASRNRLLCMDVLAATVVSIDSSGEIRRHPLPSGATTVLRRRAIGGFVIATEHGLIVADDDLAKFAHLSTVVDDPAVRTNDGGCDPLGGFIIGTMRYDEHPGGGTVYRVGPGQTVTEILAPVSISNGVQWSADGKRVYYIDTPTRRVDVFDVDRATGAWSNRRVHLNLDDQHGLPDGMAIDNEDGLWVALWGGGKVIHFDFAGRVVGAVHVPGVSQVSSCTFGSQDQSLLYITTSAKDLPLGQEPNAGAVFATQTAVRGATMAEFAG